MAAQFIKIGSEFQVNLAPQQDNNQTDPDVTVVTGGRFLMVFEDEVVSGPSPDNDLVGQFFNPDGAFSGGNFIIRSAAGDQRDPAVAPRTTGAGTAGAVVVWEDTTSAAGDIKLAIISSAGANITSGTELNVVTATTGVAERQRSPDVATLADGRSLIVWQHALSGNSDINARILDAAGTAFTTADRIVVNNSNFSQTSPAVAASLNIALVVYEDNSRGNADIEARLFNGATFDPAFLVADHSSSLSDPDVAALADNRFVVVYAEDTIVFGRVFDPSTPGGTFLSAEFQIHEPGELARTPKVFGAIDGGFIVTWSTGGADDIRAQRFDAHGLSLGNDFIVNTLKDSEQDRPVVATSGSNVLFAWSDFGSIGRTDTDSSGVRAQAFTTTAFDYDSGRFGDFGPNGRSDILFQNDTGDIAFWQTNSAGALSAISSLGSLPSGFRIDGTGNFNSTAGADILLRSTNSVAVLPMNGTTLQPMQALGGVPTEFLNSGIGDFTGDGQDDLLFRHVNSGEIATWGVANNALSTVPRVLGSTSSQFHIVAVDDFTGDHQADILFRHDNGDIAIWRVANNALAGAPSVVGSTSTAFHIVSTGDFDGNGSNDILFRNDSGDLAMWLLNSQGQLLGAPAAIGNAGLQFHVEGTGDLNGDGRSDIVFRDANGSLVEWLMNGTTFAAPPAVIGTASVDYAIAAHHFDLI